MASIRPPWPAAWLWTRRTATVTISQVLALRLACIASRLGYLPVPVIRRLLKLRPAITSGSLGAGVGAAVVTTEQGRSLATVLASH